MIDHIRRLLAVAVVFVSGIPVSLACFHGCLTLVSVEAQYLGWNTRVCHTRAMYWDSPHNAIIHVLGADSRVSSNWLRLAKFHIESVGPSKAYNELAKSAGAVFCVEGRVCVVPGCFVTLASVPRRLHVCGCG